MITQLANLIARKSLDKDIDAEDLEVVAYGYEILLQKVAVILIELLIAIPFGLVAPVLLADISYSFLRQYSGGLHAKSRTVCMITSVFVIFGVSFIASRGGMHVPFVVLPVLYVVNFALLWKYAPADTEQQPIDEPARIKLLKKASLIVLACYFAGAALLWNHFRAASVILVAMPTIVSCFTHPLAYKLYGCKKSLTQF